MTHGALSDQPARDDALHFEPYVRTLADIIADPSTQTPLTIGVFGDWGRGKTSLMRMVERDLVEGQVEDGFTVAPVWFNAWLYSRDEALWRALIARVVQAVLGFPGLDEATAVELRRLETRLYAPERYESGQIALPTGSLPGLEGATLPALTALELLRRRAVRDGDEKAEASLAEIIADVEASQTLTRRDHLVALDDFRLQFERLSHEHIEPRGRLVIFVDDLDRCLPEAAVEVLEAIKLFLDVPGIVFVLGVDQSVLEEGIRVRYGQRYGREMEALDGARYLEKIIQIPLNLPQLQSRDIEGYVTDLAAGLLPDVRCERVFAVGLEPNPRRIKRTLNVFLLLWRLSQNQPDLRRVIRPVRLAKIVVIQQYHRDLFTLLAQGPHYLPDLERRLREMAKLPAEEREVQIRMGLGTGTGSGEGPTAGPLQAYLGRSLLRALLTCTDEDEEDANFADLKPDQVAAYLFLTRTTTPEEEGLIKKAPARKMASGAARPEGAEAAEPVHVLEPQMVTVPAGPFLMGTTKQEVGLLLKEFKGSKQEDFAAEQPHHTLDLPEFQIARYPVTNADFARFIDDGGYGKRDYWTQAGWEWKEKVGRAQPELWQGGNFSAPAQPVVGVTWYEAVAYCNWLAARTGKPYRLPSEAEWEKAASWDAGAEGRPPGKRRFPWGEQAPTPEFCNFGKNQGRPTPVGQYSPQGDSPCGCADMAGNVLEWCSTKWAEYYQDDGRRADDDLEGEAPRVVRGGSWANDAVWCRSSAARRLDPRLRSNSSGFRCVVVPSSRV